MALKIDRFCFCRQLEKRNTKSLITFEGKHSSRSLNRHKVINSNISGLNQLLWYYADLEKKKCLDDMYSRRDTLEGLMHGRRSNKVGPGMRDVTARKHKGIIMWMRVGGINLPT